MKYICPIMMLMVLLLTGCYDQATNGDHGAISDEQRLKGDNTIYGLACDGCSDSVIVLLPNAGGDPVKYNIIRAMKNQQVFGEIEIGDELAVVVNPNDKNEATEVIDLEMLKGTWTFQVTPKLKPSATKTEDEILAEMSDSMKEALFVPSEYGFTLRSHNLASPVGYIQKQNTLEDESPVEYPKVTVYTGWHIFNGMLYIYKDTVDEKGKRLPNDSVGHDDGKMVFLSTDSMAALFGKKVMQYHRKANATEANKQAQAAVNKQAQQNKIK